MGSYQNPVGAPDPFDKYRVEEIGERQSKGDQPPRPDDEPPKGKEGLAAQLLQILQKAVDYFIERHAYRKTGEIEARNNLLSLKTFFEILKNEDRSQDVAFLNELSKTWNKAIEDSLNLGEEAALKFKVLTKKILHYPENQLHTFGYYLTEYAGQKWVPFPYMELVQKIHYEHEKNPPSSALTEWALLLDEVLQLLNDK